MLSRFGLRHLGLVCLTVVTLGCGGGQASTTTGGGLLVRDARGSTIGTLLDIDEFGAWKVYFSAFDVVGKVNPTTGFVFTPEPPPYVNSILLFYSGRDCAGNAAANAISGVACSDAEGGRSTQATLLVLGDDRPYGRRLGTAAFIISGTFQSFANQSVLRRANGAPGTPATCNVENNPVVCAQVAAPSSNFSLALPAPLSIVD